MKPFLLGAALSVRRRAARAWASLPRHSPLFANSHVFLLAFSLFLLPNAIFAAALRPLPATLLSIGAAGVLALSWRAARKSRFLGQPVDAVTLALCLAGGFALCLLGGEGHFFYSNTD